jgi:hypothetical protein
VSEFAEFGENDFGDGLNETKQASGDESIVIGECSELESLPSVVFSVIFVCIISFVMQRHLVCITEQTHVNPVR